MSSNFSKIAPALAPPSSRASSRRRTATTTSPIPRSRTPSAIRLLHPAHRIVLKGPSRRKEASPEKLTTTPRRFAPIHDHRSIAMITMAGNRH
jgi:hypothetical protein